jgi:hypothetical protein
MFKQTIIFLVFLLIGLTLASQSSSTLLFNQLKNIQSVPFWYTPLADDDSLWKTYQFNKPLPLKDADSTYADIVKRGKKVIHKLIPYLSDSTLTIVKNKCDTGYITVGQLTYFIINDIEQIPLPLVTGTYFHTGGGDCITILPYGLLYYLQQDGERFEKLYRKYFYSKQRQQYLKKTRQRPLQ